MCIQNPDINIQGNFVFSFVHQSIAPSFVFTCNGRITGVAASLRVDGGTELPVFQVWHPVLPGSSVYTIVGQVHFQSVVQINESPSIFTVLLTKDDQIEFQSGDVIAFYQPNNPSHSMRYIFDATIVDTNYTSYLGLSTNATVDINAPDYSEFPYLSLMNITTGKYSYKP